MISGDGKPATIWRVVESGHDRRRFVNRKMVRIILLHSVGRSVVDRTLTDPGPDQIDLGWIQRIPLLRHLRFTIDGGDHFDQFTLVRLMRNDHRMLPAAGEQAGKTGHHVATLGFCWLMAAVAIGLKDGTDVAVITDRSRFLERGLSRPRSVGGPVQSVGDEDANYRVSEQR